MTLISMISLDLFKCRPPGAPGDGSGDVWVAVPPDVVTTTSSESIDGEGWTYDTYDLATQSRVAHGPGGITETQVITPRWIPGHRIPVAKCANTSVLYNDSDQAPYIAVTARAWAAKNSDAS